MLEETQLAQTSLLFHILKGIIILSSKSHEDVQFLQLFFVSA
jgi:hypothetical protein